MVLAHPAYCQGGAELEAIRALATRPRATHFFKLPWPEQTHPFVTQTPWDVLLREMEEFVDMSARPRHCAQLIQLNRNGARDLATALRQLNRSVEMLFRDDRHLVVPLLESGVVLVAQELGLLLPTTPFTYHSASSSGAAQACSSASAAPWSIFAASPEGQPADDGTRETGERQESEALDSPAKAEAIEELKPMLQPRLESRGVAWEDAHVKLRKVSLEVLHSCLQAADVRPILVFVFQALDMKEAAGEEDTGIRPNGSHSQNQSTGRTNKKTEMPQIPLTGVKMTNGMPQRPEVNMTTSPPAPHFQGMPPQGMRPFQGMPFQGRPPQGMPFQGMGMGGMPFRR